MRLFRGIDSLEGWTTPTTVTIGSFDGVHSGHAVILKTLKDRAVASGTESVVVSFSPHPRVTLGRAEGLKLLTSDREKGELLSECGVDNFVLIEFDEEFSRLSYDEFVETYLIKRLNMQELVVGFNHHMGHDRGGYSSLQTLSQRLVFSVTQVEEHFEDEDSHVSSTSIRQLLESGDLTQAKLFMSHPYLMIGYADVKGRVLLDEPLKLILPVGCYSAEVNGLESQIEIDSEQSVWCEFRECEVIIKF